MIGKAKRKKFERRTDESSSGILDLIHSDIGGKISPPSIGGGNYYVTFLDDFSNFCTVYILKRKSEVFEKFQVFKEMVENGKERKIKMFKSDNGPRVCK